MHLIGRVRRVDPPRLEITTDEGLVTLKAKHASDFTKGDFIAATGELESLVLTNVTLYRVFPVSH